MRLVLRGGVGGFGVFNPEETTNYFFRALKADSNRLEGNGAGLLTATENTFIRGTAGGAGTQVNITVGDPLALV